MYYASDRVVRRSVEWEASGREIEQSVSGEIMR